MGSGKYAGYWRDRRIDHPGILAGEPRGATHIHREIRVVRRIGVGFLVNRRMVDLQTGTCQGRMTQS